MEWSLYVPLSLMMFLQFAVWGAWSPVLAARLLGPLKMSGKQTGWVYGTLYLGAIISPLIAGQIADRWWHTEDFLAGAHLAGGVLLLLAARQRRFLWLFLVMCLYALAFAPTLGLVNSLMFRHIARVGVEPFAIMIWGVVAWVLVGWALTAWRRLRPGGQGADCLVLAGLISLVLGVYCIFLPDTPPPGSADDALPFVKALGMLSQPSFLVFLIVAFVLATQLQFYFLGTAQYLGDLGVRSGNVPAVMSIAQAAQFVAMLLMAFWQTELLDRIGFRWAFTLGVVAWLAMYLAYATHRAGVMIPLQALHGVAYTLFIGLGYVYVDKVAPKDIAGSAQGLYVVVLFGFGLFLGTQFTGVVMDRLKSPDGKFRWRAIYLVPCAAAAACAIAMAALFRG